MKEFIVTPDLYANKGKRLGNFIVDLIVFRVLIIAIFAILGFIVVTIGGDIDSFLYQLETINPFMDLLITYVLYFFVFWGFETLLQGRTIGKFITQTKVVDINGNVPNAGLIAKRTLSRIIPFDGFSYLGEEGRGWHDTIPNLYVVDVKKFEDKKSVHFGLQELGTTNNDFVDIKF
ncbi:RDD family protein [Spongiivirga citrea]|uniref:RDD domain-containing protein n=1 Tax=Spongiivirga citrea TaxID=1481457 RepID=A0A6M0CM66_9FLAO|nr:RDD family protein [Spongiivirga citrea]NER19038.1 hypothetical protein [Spongiivirga citrea]